MNTCIALPENPLNLDIDFGCPQSPVPRASAPLDQRFTPLPSGLTTASFPSSCSTREKNCASASCRDGRPCLLVPDFMFDGQGNIKKAFRHQDYDGFYVSPEGQAYSSRSCWADDCD